jgi:ArsR family transcriptional regulator
MIQTVELFKALSDMNRLRIVVALGRYEELCACQITELLQVTGATVSRHLGVLQHAGVLKSRKEGRFLLSSRSSGGRGCALPMGG